MTQFTSTHTILNLMNSRLPDVSLVPLADDVAPLDWVGMESIDLPVVVGEPGIQYPVHARVGVYVDLPDPHVKGIHMSRLHHRLNAFAGNERLSPASLRALLADLVHSHADCGSGRAMVTWDFNFLRKRAALVTEGLSGWQAYPVRIEARLDGTMLHVALTATVTYSSTCPCSAALSRQLIQQAFLARFGTMSTVKPAEIASWLEGNASLATPHSQRSVAAVTVELDEAATRCGIAALIDVVEAALGTPVQTAVKRADEQAFARLNGDNLMFVEDAARKIQAALAGRYASPVVSVRHLESLHPHDAVAQSSRVEGDQ